MVGGREGCQASRSTRPVTGTAAQASRASFITWLRDSTDAPEGELLTIGLRDSATHPVHPTTLLMPALGLVLAQRLKAAAKAMRHKESTQQSDGTTRRLTIGSLRPQQDSSRGT